jgi:hypothetical protein
MSLIRSWFDRSVLSEVEGLTTNGLVAAGPAQAALPIIGRPTSVAFFTSTSCPLLTS